MSAHDAVHQSWSNPKLAERKIEYQQNCTCCQGDDANEAPEVVQGMEDAIVLVTYWLR